MVLVLMILYAICTDTRMTGIVNRGWLGPKMGSMCLERRRRIVTFVFGILLPLRLFRG